MDEIHGYLWVWTQSDECSRYTADFYRSLAESYLINSSHISKYSYVPKIKIFYTIAASVLEHTIYSDIVFIFSEHFSLIFASYGGGIRICDLLVWGPNGLGSERLHLVLTTS